MYEFYQQKLKDSVLKDTRKELKKLYEQIPATTGCMENMNHCHAKCCEVQNPQVMFAEFQNTWNYINNSWPQSKIIQLVVKCIRNYLNKNINKSCVFWEKESGHCIQHNTRPFNCLHPNTWVYTNDGPKMMKDILAGDMVLSHDGKYHKVLYAWSKIYDGEILKIKPKGNGLYVMCTPEHEWFSLKQKEKRQKKEPSFCRADELVRKTSRVESDYLSYPRKNEDVVNFKTLDITQFNLGVLSDGRISPFTTGSGTFSGHKKQSIPSEIMMDDEFLFMIGVYLAEGYSSSSSSTFCMNIFEMEIIQRIALYLNSLGIRSNLRTKKNNLLLRIDSSMFGRLMKILCGELAKNKKLNSLFFNKCSLQQLFSIFKGWDCGDGTKNQSHHLYRTTTISEALAVQMAQILLLNNLYPRISVAYRTERGNAVYNVIVNHSSVEGCPHNSINARNIFSDEFVHPPLDTILRERYIGPVCDIEVSETSSFVTVSGIVHNCRMYSQVPEDEFEPRFTRLKVLYPENEFMPQCNLTKTDGNKPTVAESDMWFSWLKKIESELVDKSDIHYNDGGSYRAYHDHILLTLCSGRILSELTKLRDGTDGEKEDYIHKMIINMEKQSVKKS